MIVGLLLSAVLFAALYFPVFKHYSLLPVSPYTKADVRKRLVAAAIDGVPVAASWLAWWTSGSILLPILGSSYLVLRDGMRGQSVGKLLAGLVVMDLPHDRPCGLTASVVRNVVFLIPGANVVAAVLETISATRDPQGQRLGDRVAQTQVVEGFGVRDLAAAFVAWWRSFIGALEPQPRRPQKAPRPQRIRRGVRAERSASL